MNQYASKHVLKKICCPEANQYESIYVSKQRIYNTDEEQTLRLVCLAVES